MVVKKEVYNKVEEVEKHMEASLKVLIIEDNPTDAELAEREIIKEFTAVECKRVETREDYISLLDEWTPDIIVSDYMLPSFDGMAALTIALQRAPDVPFIIFTGSMNEETAVTCMKAGAWDYVIKEHLKRLGPAMRSVLQEKEARLEREKARRETEKAYKVKKDFLANISHELRTPLNGIMGMFTILNGLEVGKEEQYWISLAKQSADKLNKIILDLLNFVQIDSEKSIVEKAPFSIDELVTSVGNFFSEEMRKKNLQLRYENTCNHSDFIGDKSRIAQVVWNLLSNAVKFSLKGLIRVETEEKDYGLTLVIEDEGIGIEEEKREEIFLPLEQLEDPYTKTHPGIGLGLAIVKSQIELMEGEIRVHSVPGKGSRFEVTIPGTFSNRVGPDEGTSTKIADSSGEDKEKTILVVEDEAINRLYICSLLKKQGFTVREARNGQEAIDSATAAPPDLILMDIGLPLLSGLEATKRIIEIPATKNIPIVAVTAHAEREEKEQFLRGGMREVLTKPYREADLLKVVRRYV